MITIKKSCRLLSLTLLFMLPGYSQGAASLLADDGVEILLINGAPPSPEHTRPANNAFRLQDGMNQLVIRYEAEINSGGDEELLYSDVFVISFRAANPSLRLQAPALKSEQELNNFNQLAAWILTTSNGEVVLFAAEALKKTGFQLNRDYHAELAAFNRGNSPAALTAAYSAPFSATRLATSNNLLTKDSLDTNIALSNLKYWYRHADSHTRNSFLAWLNAQ